MTTIGIIAEATPADVSPHGVLTIGGGSDVVDWWIGAEDRWYRAGEERAVRQRLTEDGTSVETRIKVPGGDVVQRIGAAPFRGAGVVLVEITNETPVPVALAIAVSGSGPISVYEDTVRVDGVATVRANRAVARFASAPDTATLTQRVNDGLAVPPAELVDAADEPIGACIFPLPHTARLRFVVALDPGALASLPTPDDLPELADIDRGWDTHLEAGMRMNLPDERVHRATDSSLRHLLIASGQPVGALWNALTPSAPAIAAIALAEWGHARGGRELLLRASADQQDDPSVERGPEAIGSYLWAWAELAHHQLDDPELMDALRAWVLDHVDVLVALAPRRGLLRRKAEPDATSSWWALGMTSAASLLTMLGETDVASDIVDALADVGGHVTPGSLAAAVGGHRLGFAGPGPVLAALANRLGHEPVGTEEFGIASAAAIATETGAFTAANGHHDAVASALFLLGLRRALVEEPLGHGGPISLLSGLEPDWLGASMEVHRSPVAGGTVDVAVRWHGERPALLWDTRLDRPAQLSTPLLDPNWSDDRPKAEALLAPTPGVAIEEAPESARVRRGEIKDIDPDNPISFS